MPELATAPEPQATAATSAIPPVAAPVAVETPTQSKTEIMEALFEAQTTGKTSDITRLKGELEKVEKAPVQAEPEPEPVVEQPAAVIEEVAAEPASVEPVEPVSEPATGDEPVEELPGRFRFKSAEDRLVAQTAKTFDISLTEAARRLSGSAAPAAETTPPAPVIIPPTIADMEANVMDLEAKLDDANPLDPEYKSITKQLSRANADLSAARIAIPIAERESAREDAVFATQRETADASARQQYPALNDPNSAMFQLWYEYSLAAHNPGHVDHAKAQDINAPLYFAQKAAKTLGLVKPVAKAPVIPAPPAAQLPPATRPAAATKGSTPPPPAKTSADNARDAEAEFEAATTGRMPAVRPRVGGVIIRA